MAQEISIEFTRFSAFYSPLIATFAGGFLKEEGLAPSTRCRRRANRPSPACSMGGARGAVGTVAEIRSAGAGQGAAGAALRPDQREGRLLPDGPQPRPGLLLGQAQGPEGDGGPRRPADRHVQVRLLQARAGFGRHRGDRCRLHRQDDRRLPRRPGGLHPSARPGAAAAGARWCRPYRRLGRRGDRAVRLLQPRRHARVARIRQAKAFMRAYRKARAWLIATPAAEVAKAEAPFFRVSIRRCWRPPLPPIRSSATGARMSRSPAPPSRRRSTSSSTRG